MHRKSLKKTISLGLSYINDDASNLGNTSFIVTNPMPANNNSLGLWCSSKARKLFYLGSVNYLMGRLSKQENYRIMILKES